MTCFGAPNTFSAESCEENVDVKNSYFEGCEEDEVGRVVVIDVAIFTGSGKVWGFFLPLSVVL
jgi:hypothetical protein